LSKILVTGYDGFIGSHLTDKLLNEYQVIGLSNNKKGKKEIQQIKKDIRKISIYDIPKNIDCIIHLAAITDVAFCQDHPLDCYDVNVLGTQKLLEIARKINSKFIFLSTSHVYGIPTKLPISENHPRHPTSIYAGSKLAAEIICESYATSYGMNISIIRLFSVYGPKSPPHLVIQKIISQLMKNNTIRLGNLSPKRDFIYIDDVIQAIQLVLKKSKTFNVYNVGSEKNYSILQVCEIIKKLTQRDFKIKSIKSLSRKVEIDKVVSNSTKIKKLGWKPKTSIQKGLKKTFEYYVSQLK